MGDPGKDREALVERAASAHRSRSPHGEVQAHPAWFDLDESGRVEAFDLASRLRRLEAAMDPDDLSTTGRAVLARILAARGG